MSEQGKEVELIGVDRAGATQMTQLTQWVAARWRTKPLINQFAELRPRRVALIVVQTVAFEAVIPLLGNPFHVKGGQPYLFNLGRSCCVKKLIAAVKPRQRIPGAVVLWKTQLLRCCVQYCAADGGRRSITARRPRSRADVDVLGQDRVDGNVQATLIGFDHSDLIIYRRHLHIDRIDTILHGDHLAFEDGDLAQHILKELLDVVEG
jgi:hypothetical protein